MSPRQWIHSSLTTLAGGRVHQNTSIREDASTRTMTKPFIVHRFAVDRGDLRGDDITKTYVEEVQLFVHDVPGDYTVIDGILIAMRGLLDGRVDQPNGIIRCTWLEDSEDFRDDKMGTILRYGRYQIKHRS